jgi:sporulation protein YlmC with PRC-barrel domain
MRTLVSAAALFGLMGTAAMFLAPVSKAQQGTTAEPTRNVQQDTTTAPNRTGQQENRAQGTQIGVLDEHTSGATIRASQLIGMNIENQKGEGVGEINDLVIDGNTGQVRYAAVTYGGFLGLGDKLFAVPFEAFKVRRQTGDADDHVLTLDVTQQQLEGAVGFDQENWPNFADRNFTRELDLRYGIDRSTRTGRVGDIDTDGNERR